MVSVTVREYERVLRYDRGVLAGVLGPGRHRYLAWRTTLTRVDLRLRVSLLGGQEVLTSDGVTVKVSLVASWRVSDPVAFVHQSAQPEALLHATLQVGLRDEVAAVAAASLAGARDAVGRAVADVARDALAPYGIALETTAVRDVMFAGDLKRVFAQPAIARQEALAALERARGESAALRALANAARALDGNPALAQLRLLQSVGEGATLVVTPSPAQT